MAGEKNPVHAAAEKKPQAEQGKKAPAEPEKKVHLAGHEKKMPQPPMAHGHKPKAPAAQEPESLEPVHSAQELDRLGKRALSDDEREMKVKMGLGKSVLGIFSPTVTISEEDVRDLLDELELELLESDVAYEVSAEVTAQLRAKLVGAKLSKGGMQAQVQTLLNEVLAGVMRSPQQFDFVERVKSVPKPAKVLFVGPNGAGKTTTMAKIARRLQENGLTVVFSASDTFRAAAIEQTEVHAQRLGVPVVKSGYGADPAAVAFDAVKYAKAHKIDVVLIDSAGRQDTNANLLDELKKINRIIQPDLKIYIGESIGGNALIEQIKGFHAAIGIDGAVLTKLDCDAKGGTAISLTHATGGVPILFLGTGQGYEDLEVFDAQKVAHQILGNEAS